MSVYGFNCTLVGSIYVINVVASGYRFDPLFMHSGLHQDLQMFALKLNK